ncbi:unnamed protein product [Mycena citricolor]|uniref:Uncharacterized protein n=1 Tax=Mycena citricolor TaxID=2018698 RepID=A0AAD2HBU9_9AGAR|nr:unnamed protein product [Mycena citricolor]
MTTTRRSSASSRTGKERSLTPPTTRCSARRIETVRDSIHAPIAEIEEPKEANHAGVPDPPNASTTHAEHADPAPAVAETPATTPAELPANEPQTPATVGPDVAAERPPAAGPLPQPTPTDTSPTQHGRDLEREDFPPLPSPGRDPMNDAEGNWTPVVQKKKSKGKTSPGTPQTKPHSRLLTDETAATRAETPPASDNELPLPARVEPVPLASLMTAPSRTEGENAAGESPSPKRARSNSAGDYTPRPSGTTSDFSVSRDPSTEPQPAETEPEKPHYTTADSEPPRGVFFTTPGGQGVLAGLNIESLTAHLSEERKQNFSGIDVGDRYKFYVRVSGGNGNRLRTKKLMRELLAGCCNVAPDSIIIADPNCNRTHAEPTAWLVANIPGEVAYEVVDDAILANEHITLFTYDFNPPISGYLGAMTNLDSFPPTGEGEAALLTFLRRALFDHPEVKICVDKNREAYNMEVPIDEILEEVKASLCAQHITVRDKGGLDRVYWNIYCTPTTQSYEGWKHVHGKVKQVRTAPKLPRLQANPSRQLIFNHEIDGQIYIAETGWNCQICYGTDHPTGLCQLPNNAGWPGPTSKTIAAFIDYSWKATSRMRNDLYGRRNGNDATGQTSGRNHHNDNLPPHLHSRRDTADRARGRGGRPNNRGRGRDSRGRGGKQNRRDRDLRDHYEF